MGDVVAAEAFRELSHDARGMRRSMAALAGRYCFVFSLVTFCACQQLVLCDIGAQEICGFFVALGAARQRKTGRERHKPGCMRLVALFAVSRSQLRPVRLVALRALRDLTVDLMTDCAVERAVFALAFHQLINLEPVAVETVGFVPERYIQRRVGLRVTVEAAPAFDEMGLLCLQVAFIARRDRLLHFGRMTRVAAYAGDAPVFFPGRCYVIYLCGMTLHAFISCIRIFSPG